MTHTGFVKKGVLSYFIDFKIIKASVNEADFFSSSLNFSNDELFPF